MNENDLTMLNVSFSGGNASSIFEELSSIQDTDALGQIDDGADIIGEMSYFN